MRLTAGNRAAGNLQKVLQEEIMKIRTAFLAINILIAATSARANNDFPSRAITIVNLYAPGGGIDFVARSIAQKLNEKWKVPVVVENKPGAGGTIAAANVARQPADGYTIFITDVSYSTAPSIYSKLGYDPMKDLQPLVLLNTVTQAFTVTTALGVNSIKELIELAKKKPGKLTYASAGTGSLPHIGVEMFKKATGTDIRQVPYRGSIPAFNDLMAGRVDMYVGALATPLPYIQAGTMKALAVMQSHRSALVPEVPSIVELGYPELDFAAYYGLLVPAGTPKPVADKLTAAVQEALKTPELKTIMDQLGNEIVGAGPEEFKAFLQQSMETWRKGFVSTGEKPM
jgi:tripartite-type tricarboxylate transporter receptor subunit TctC